MAALQVRVQRSEDTSGFLLGRGEKMLPLPGKPKGTWDPGHAGDNDDDMDLGSNY